MSVNVKPSDGAGGGPPANPPPTNPPVQPTSQPAATTDPPKDQPPAQPGDTLPADLQARYMEAVAKNEAQVFQLQNQLKALQDERDSLKGQAEKWSSDPFAAFQEAGGNVNEILDRITNDGQPSTESTVQKLQQTVESLQQELQRRDEESKKTEAQKEEDRYFTDHATDVRRIVEQSEDYKPVTQAMAVERDIFGRDPDLAAIVKVPFKQQLSYNGQGLTPAQSAGKLLKESKILIERIARSQAIREIVLGSQPGQDPPPQPKPTPTPQPRTMTQDLGQNSDQADPATMSESQWLTYAAAKARKAE